MDLELDAIAQRYGMLPNEVADSDVENVRVYRTAKEVEIRLAEKNNG